ncbi:MAG: YkgJ family cysteine cluster protein [Bacteroidia bacterium]
MTSRNIDLKAFKLKASRKKKTYMTFLKGIHKRKERKQIDKWARELDKEAFAKIDCLSCGNCCKTMTPTFLPSDIKRIAKDQKISTREFHERYLMKDGKDLVNKNVPCQFLNPDNKCRIYAIRPADCRGFPHTHKANPGFVKASSVNQTFFFRCPIVFHVVENIFKRVVEKEEV